MAPKRVNLFELIRKSGVTTNTYAYNGFDARTMKTDSLGTNTFRRAGAGVTSPLLADSNATYTPGISEKRTGATRYLHSGLKNADSQTDSNKTIMATRDYDAFGNVIGSTGTWNGPFGNAGGFGYQEDPDHGLKLLGHRYNDSSTGRFLSRDSAEDGRNWYTYCENNPVSSYDNEGLKKKLIILVGSLGDLGKVDDVRNATIRCIEYIRKFYEDVYDIEIRVADNRADWERALYDADAIVFIGHGGGGLTRDGRGMDDQTVANATRRRQTHGKGKLDFIRLYACSEISSQHDADRWLWIANLVLGFDGNCYPGIQPNKAGKDGGETVNGSDNRKVWQGAPQRKMPAPAGRGPRGSRIMRNPALSGVGLS